MFSATFIDIIHPSIVGARIPMSQFMHFRTRQWNNGMIYDTLLYVTVLLAGPLQQGIMERGQAFYVVRKCQHRFLDR